MCGICACSTLVSLQEILNICQYCCVIHAITMGVRCHHPDQTQESFWWRCNEILPVAPPTVDSSKGCQLDHQGQCRSNPQMSHLSSLLTKGSKWPRDAIVQIIPTKPQIPKARKLLLFCNNTAAPHFSKKKQQQNKFEKKNSYYQVQEQLPHSKSP